MTETNMSECRFCLKIIYDNNFDIIGEVIKQMLNALLLKVNLDKDKDSVMCLECATKLQNAVDFKTTCLNTDSKVSPLIDLENNVKLMSEAENCKKNSDVELTDTPKDQKVCQFCMSLTWSGNCTYLQDRKESEVMINMVQKHIPELHLSISGELVTCDTCHSSLQNLSSFVTVCSETERKIKKTKGKAVDGQFKSSDSKDFLLKNENVTDIKDNYNVSVENITVKNEVGYEDCTEIDNLDVVIDNAGIEMKLEHNDNESATYGCEEEQTEMKDDLKKQTVSQHREATRNLYDCEWCSFTTRRKNILITHTRLHHPSKVEMYNCESCPYVTDRKGNLKRHSAIHRRVRQPKVETYGCDYCSLKAKIKQSLKSHKLIYSESTSFISDQCSCKKENKQS